VVIVQSEEAFLLAEEDEVKTCHIKGMFHDIRQLEYPNVWQRI